ncbi:MAG: lysylphosphatidylglycerol synthase transmembrane domain-containing protein [Bacteroidota bacterium]
MFKSKTILIIQYIAFALISVGLVYYCFGKIDLSTFYNTLLKGNYSILFLVTIVSLVVYYIRIKRWQYLLKSLHYKLAFNTGFASLASCYLVSFVVPRAGEIVRCAITKQTDKIDLTANATSIIFERLVDILCLFILLVSLLGIELFIDTKILLNWIDFNSYVLLIKKYAFLGIIGVVAVGIFLYLNKIQKINQFLIKLWLDIKILLQYATNIGFLAQTLAIWCCYFLMTYLWFFVFESTSQLSLLQALQITLVGSLARSLPLPGGAMGAYHLAVALALNKMHIDNETALSLAFIIHGFQTVYTFFVGSTSLTWLLLTNKIYRIK